MEPDSEDQRPIFPPLIPRSRSQHMLLSHLSHLNPDSNISQPKSDLVKVNKISIDQNWICKNSVKINPDFLCCPICFQLIFTHMQCPSCQRLLCSECTKNTLKSTSKCPLCKAHPWNPKKQLHLSYRQILAGMRLTCKICEQANDQSKGTQYILSDISKHLIKNHSIIPPGVQVFKLHFLTSSNQEVIKFSELENLQLIYNFQQGHKISYVNHQWKGQSYPIKINFEKMECKHPMLGKCQIKTQIVQDHVPKKWIFWTFQNDYNKNQFYTQKQQVMIEKNYQDFLKNKNFNQFMLDMNEKRYRINFVTNCQINTFTQFQRKIERISFTK